MILATLLLLGIAPNVLQPHGAARQSASPTTPSSQNPTAGQGQAETPPTQTPPVEIKSTNSTSVNPQTKPTAKHIAHKKKTATSNCGALPAPASSANSVGSGRQAAAANPSSTPPEDAPAPGNTTAPPPAAPEPCPPQKIIVRHGGTSQPAIQLAGGPSNDQALRQRDVVNQLLAVTDRNLKGITGRQLNSNEQDTVTQIHQFMDQSKAAVAAGDLDRARTLAWKAEMLSEDLAKPQN